MKRSKKDLKDKQLFRLYKEWYNLHRSKGDVVVLEKPIHQGYFFEFSLDKTSELITEKNLTFWEDLFSVLFPRAVVISRYKYFYSNDYKDDIRKTKNLSKVIKHLNFHEYDKLQSKHPDILLSRIFTYRAAKYGNFVYRSYEYCNGFDAFKVTRRKRLITEVYDPVYVQQRKKELQKYWDSGEFQKLDKMYAHKWDYREHSRAAKKRKWKKEIKIETDTIQTERQQDTRVDD
jgi:hypothetical protein